ncbi:hypothetical protein ACU4GH_39450 [Bradyrhizobium betae]
MRDLSGIDSDLMKSQQQCKALQSRILTYGFQSRPCHYFRSSSPLLHVVLRKQNEISLRLWMELSSNWHQTTTILADVPDRTRKPMHIPKGDVSFPFRHDCVLPERGVD